MKDLPVDHKKSLRCFSDESLAAFVDGSAPSKKLEAWRSHIAKCESCRKRVAEVTLLKRSLKKEALLTAPESLKRRVAAELGRRNVKQQRGRFFLPGWLPAPLPAMATVALLAAALGVWFGKSSGIGPAATPGAQIASREKAPILQFADNAARNAKNMLEAATAQKGAESADKNEPVQMAASLYMPQYASLVETDADVTPTAGQMRFQESQIDESIYSAMADLKSYEVNSQDEMEAWKKRLSDIFDDELLRGVKGVSFQESLVQRVKNRLAISRTILAHRDSDNILHIFSSVDLPEDNAQDYYQNPGANNYNFRQNPLSTVGKQR